MQLVNWCASGFLLQRARSPRATALVLAWSGAVRYDVDSQGDGGEGNGHEDADIEVDDDELSPR